MSAYLGKSRRIKNALTALLTAVTYDTGNGPEPAFTQVLDNMRNIFDGWPNAQVLPGDITTDRPTTNQSDHATAFIIRVRIPLESLSSSDDISTPDERQSAAYDQMYDLTDLVIDAVEDADRDNDFGQVISTYMMDANRGDWIVVAAADGDVLLCDVNVVITYSKDLQ